MGSIPIGGTIYKGAIMSYYYNYCIGYKSGGIIYPLGPYDRFGKISYVISKSSSFASDLHIDFETVKDEEFSEELLRDFSYTNYKGETEVIPVRYLPLKNLPDGDFIKKGYFLIADVIKYEDGYDEFDLFYEYVTPTVYAAMLDHEIKFGKPKDYKDEFGDLIRARSASDYMYYAYPDYTSREFESFLIQNAADSLWDSKLPKDAEMVALETEG